MPEPARAIKTEPSPFPVEDLKKILRRFSWRQSGDEVRCYYRTKKDIDMNIRNVNIHCLQNIQIDIELKGGKGNAVWRALENEINRRIDAEGKK
jgi:hypothetical protein